MHIFFSGIGGGAIGPLALIAKQAGYEVSGSDKQESYQTQLLQDAGIEFHIGQTEEKIAAVHQRKPIDWFVYSSGVYRENSQHPELVFARTHGIRHTLRDALLSQIITDNKLQLVAVAGTHGKSTTTAMAIWLFHELGQPISYSVGASIPFGPIGTFTKASNYFVYECDEFDRNFLAFHPYLSLITGIGWDHHEVFPTRDNYNQAFKDFIQQSKHTILWPEEQELLHYTSNARISVISPHDPHAASITLPGLENRLNALQVVYAVHRLTASPLEELIGHINRFPGLKQRMEKLAPNLYTNYAHTPEKIRGGMNTALDIAKAEDRDIVVLYEPLTNRRQHYIKDDYKDCFDGAKKIYWLPSYLAREDPNLALLSPADLIPHISNPSIAEPAGMDDTLLATIRSHLQAGDIVVNMGASGGGSLDEWLRAHAKELSDA